MELLLLLKLVAQPGRVYQTFFDPLETLLDHLSNPLKGSFGLGIGIWIQLEKSLQLALQAQANLHEGLDCLRIGHSSRQAQRLLDLVLIPVLDGV